MAGVWGAGEQTERMSGASSLKRRKPVLAERITGKIMRLKRETSKTKKNIFCGSLTVSVSRCVRYAPLFRNEFLLMFRSAHHVS